MAQFDVYRGPQPKTFPLLVDVQPALLAGLGSRVVIPMLRLDRYGARPITHLHPVVDIDGTAYVVMAHELAAIPATALIKPVATLAAHRGALLRALDLLL